MGQTYVAVLISESAHRQFDVFETEATADAVAANRNGEIIKSQYGGYEDAWRNDPYAPKWVVAPRRHLMF